MTGERADLTIRVQVTGGAQADKQLDTLGKKGQSAEKATDGFAASLKRLAGPLLTVATATAGFNKLVEVTRQFDVLNAGLQTATGSAENAAVAFEAIQEFATTTPYDLAQATDAFTKLVNYGLTPSEEALKSYGDTASAMGKDLEQMVEAVADATTGEFERLKSFGIKARTEGDNISFTFRGVKTTVQNNAKAIEEYLIKLGQLNFAGAMEKRMATLDGAISNLGDQWDVLFLTISQQGIGDLIEEGVRTATDALAELNDQIASGQLMANIEAVGLAFSGFGEDFSRTADILVQVYSDVMKFLSESTGSTLSEITQNFDTNFRHLPENIRAFIQLIVVEIASIADAGLAAGRQLGEYLGIEFASIVEKAKVYGQAVADGLNPFSDGSYNDFYAKFEALDKQADEMQEEARQRAVESVRLARETRASSIESILAERDEDIKAAEERAAAAVKLREEYERTAAARRAQTGDRLGGFGINPEGDAGGTVGKEQQKKFDALKKSLMSEEEALKDSYDKRLEIIRNNTAAESTIRGDLEAKLKKQYEQDLEDLREQKDRELNAVRESLMSEEELLKLSYEERKKIILESTAATEEERIALVKKLDEQYAKQTAVLEAQRKSIILQNSASLFGELADLSKTFAGEQSGIYRTMFAISKAFAIADSIIKIQQGLANAASMPWPANLAAMASVAASTAGILGTIRSTQVEGVYHGGKDYVPKEATYLLDKGERVLSPRQNEDLTAYLSNQNSSNNVVPFPGMSGMAFTINVVNNTGGAPMQVEAMMDDETQMTLILTAMDNKLRQDLQDGRGVWGDAQRRYGWGTRSQY